MSQYNAGGFDPAYQYGSESARTSLLCVSALVSSVIFCCPVASLLGILLGIGGMVSVSSSNGRRKGTGLAIAAIFIAIASIVGQVALVNALKPQITSWFSGGRFISKGPVDLIGDLEKDDLVSARTYLYSASAKQISDEQLRQFREEVAARYGSIQQWQPPINQGFQFSGEGEWTQSYTGTLVFSGGSQSATIEMRLRVSPTLVFEEIGISRVVIHDSVRGDLILDVKAPTGDGEGADEGGGEGGG